MKKDQHVIICADNLLTAGRLLPYSRMCAHCLNDKGLILLSATRDEPATWVDQCEVPHIALRGRWRDAIGGMSTSLGAILAVAEADPDAPRGSLANPRQLLRQFSECKSAYICLPPHAEAEPPRSVALSLDHRRESKQKLVWASYFARFFGSNLTVALPTYRDEGLRSHQRENIQFMRKMFLSLGVTHTEVALEGSSLHDADIATLNQLHPDFMIAMTASGRDRDMVDMFYGPSGLRLLRRSTGIPILLLNQRDDLYVLCD